MSRKDKLIKSKSIYTIRSKHTSLVNGTIYENDHVTIIPNDGVYDEDMPLFSESNFKFRIGLGNGERKRHSRGGWISVDGSENNVWTLENLPISAKTDNGKITIKPNYSSLKDFAYYGSAVELLKATVNDVIMRYPGGISYYKNPPSVKVNGVTYLLVSNEFNIDFWTPIGASFDDTENPMRVLGASYMNYEDGAGRTLSGIELCINNNCLNSIIGEVKFNFSGSAGRGDGDSDHRRELELSFAPEELVFSKGLGGSNSSENSDSDDISGAADGQNNDFWWNELTVICYSGVNETNYLGNVTIPDVNVVITAKDTNNATQTLQGKSGSDGKVVFYRKQFYKLGQCITGFTAQGDINYNTFTNTLTRDCKETKEPVVNLYIHYKEGVQPGNFPYTVFVTDCETGEPVTDAYVDFFVKIAIDPTQNQNIDPQALANKPYHTKPRMVNSAGISQLTGDERTLYTRGGDSPFSFNGEYAVTEWYAIVTREEDSTTTRTLSGKINEVNVCFNIEEENVFRFTELSVYGALRVTNAPIGPGSEATLSLYDYNNAELAKLTGVTDNIGRFKATPEDFMARFPNITNWETMGSYNCSITYEGTYREGDRKYFLTTVTNPTPYSQTIYFDNNQTGSTKRLIVNVYSTNNGFITPLEGVNVVFTGVTDKSHCIFKTSEIQTDNRGIATVDIPDRVWSSTNCGYEEISDFNAWGAYCFYEGTRHDSEQTGRNYLKNGDNIDNIVIKVQNKWTSLRVNTVNGQGNPLRNAVVKVYGKLQGSSTWDYYANGTTNANGYYDFTPAVRWQHINGGQVGSVNDFSEWYCEGWYGEEYRVSNTNAIYDNQETLVFSTVTPPTPPPQPYTGCNNIDAEHGNGFFIYLDGNGKKHLLAITGSTYKNGKVILKPKAQFIDAFWSSLDDFEKVLLDKTTNPIYKARLETPYIENYKHLYKMKTYSWPVVDEIGTPDLTTGSFTSYISSLMKIAEYYDEYESDNLWRMMTHEAIKNLDWTFTRGNDDEFISSTEIDGSRLQAMLRVESRLFDDIKRYADNIKSINTISYDERNNLPDYFLSDNVELSGFEAKDVCQFSGITSDVIYSSTTISGKTDEEVNCDFLRRLALSSKYIMSMKGTRRGIEAILGMFGYKNASDTQGESSRAAGTYELDEYIAVARNFPTYDEMTSLRILAENEYPNIDNNDDMMIGYPVAVVSPATENPVYYLVPWVDHKGEYLNNIYFQEKGGWGRVHKKEINLSISKTTEINDEDFEFNIYSETAPYMVYVSDLNELVSLSNSRVYEGMVCYVTDISDIYTIYSAETDYNEVIGGEVPSTASSNTHVVQQESDRGISPPPGNLVQADPLRDFSHYFILKNKALSNYVGFVHTDAYHCYGWKNILLREFKNTHPTTVDGLKVLYLESLELNNKGNNPHCGYGNYDDGARYIEKFNRLFGTAVDSGLYDYLKDGSPEDRADYQRVVNAGFEVESGIKDNKKCHYFVKDDGGEIILGKSSSIDSSIEELHTNYGIGSNNFELKFIGCENGENHDVSVTEGGDYSVFENPEHGKKYEEAAAFSVINVKNFVITFHTGGNRYLEQYIKKVVLVYLNEMIPSTTILRYKFDDGNTHTPKLTAQDYSLSQGTTNIVVGDMATLAESGEMYLIENNDGLITSDKSQREKNVSK